MPGIKEVHVETVDEDNEIYRYVCDTCGGELEGSWRSEVKPHHIEECLTSLAERVAQLESKR